MWHQRLILSSLLITAFIASLVESATTSMHKNSQGSMHNKYHRSHKQGMTSASPKNNMIHNKPSCKNSTSPNHTTSVLQKSNQIPTPPASMKPHNSSSCKNSTKPTHTNSVLPKSKVAAPSPVKQTGSFDSNLLLCIINEERKANGQCGLTLDPRLTNSACGHDSWVVSQDINVLQAGDQHQGQGGTQPNDRMAAQGVKNCGWSEVMDMWAVDARDVVYRWTESPEHQHILFGSGDTYKYFGGCARSTNQKTISYVVDMAGPYSGCTPPAPPSAVNCTNLIKQYGGYTLYRNLKGGDKAYRQSISHN